MLTIVYPKLCQKLLLSPCQPILLYYIWLSLFVRICYSRPASLHIIQVLRCTKEGNAWTEDKKQLHNFQDNFHYIIAIIIGMHTNVVEPLADIFFLGHSFYLVFFARGLLGWKGASLWQHRYTEQATLKLYHTKADIPSARTLADSTRYALVLKR